MIKAMQHTQTYFSKKKKKTYIDINVQETQMEIKKINKDGSKPKKNGNSVKKHTANKTQTTTYKHKNTQRVRLKVNYM